MVKSYKGFDKDLKCRGMQYEVGKTYEEEKVSVCHAGLHSCENPLDVFNYYAPSNSRYCEVEADGEIDKETDEDSKIASTKLYIGIEIGLPGLIKAGVEYIKSQVDWKNNKESNTGDRSAATNTGYRSAATNTGDQSAAIVEGEESFAIAIGRKSKAKGSLGCWIVVTEWFKDEEYNWHIKDVQCAKVDGEIIKADTFYMLQDCKFVEVE